MGDKTTKLTFAAKTKGSKEVQKLGRTIGELGKIDAFRKLNDEAKVAQKAWKDAEAEVKRLALSMKTAEKPTLAMRREFEKAKKAAAGLKNEYEKTRKRISGLRESMAKSGIDTKNLVTEQKRLKDALRAVRKEAGRSVKVDAARGLLDIRPHKAIQKEIKETRLAYERLRKHGGLTSAELAQAKVKLKSRIAELKAETNGWSKSINRTGAGLLTLATAGYAALRALSGTSEILKTAEQASFNLQSSVKAANREFANTGSIEHWEKAVGRLSDELVIYSESSIKNAISRTVDMTKRLGLSTEQMEEVIKRSGDLGAGKVELTAAVERVTAALRGEAESAEYLGLTLNENYIKAWYEARGATQGAWKDLTDIQKAQVRYAAFLQQSSEMQGRAAASADTYAGALAIVKKEIANAIVNNPKVIGSFNQLAAVLRDNAEEIGNLIGNIGAFVAKIIELAATYQKTALTLGGFVGLSALWRSGLNSIAGGLVGVSQKMGLTIQASNALATAWTRLGVVGQTLTKFSGASLAAFWGAGKILEAVVAFKKMREAQQGAIEAQENLLRVTDRTKKKFEAFADIEILDNLMARPTEDLLNYKSELAKARAYFVAVMTELQQKAQETNFFGQQTEEAKKAQAELDKIVPRYKAIGEAAMDVNAALKERTRVAKEATDQTVDAAQKEKEVLKDYGDLIREGIIILSEKTRKAIENGDIQSGVLKKALAEERKALEERQKLYDMESDVKRAQLDKQLADIDLAVAKEKATVGEAAVKKAELEKTFTAAKLAELTEQLETARKLYGAESDEYKKLVQEKLAAEASLARNETGLIETRRTLAEVTERKNAAESSGKESIQKAADATRDGTDATRENTEAINENNAAAWEGSGFLSTYVSYWQKSKNTLTELNEELKRYGDALNATATVKGGEFLAYSFRETLKTLVEYKEQWDAVTNEVLKYGLQLDLSNDTIDTAVEKVQYLKEEYLHLTEHIERSQRRLDDQVRALQRSGLSDQAKYKDVQSEYYAKINDAQQAAAEGNYDLALQLYSQAKRLAKQLATEVKNVAGETISTLEENTTKAARLMKRAGEEAIKVLKKMRAQIGFSANPETLQLPQFSRGGLLGGRPHSAGGTIIEAERGEFIHPVSTVRFYSKEIMEALRRRLIDPGALRGLLRSQFTLPRFDLGGLVDLSPKPAGTYAAEGGMVTDVVELRISDGNERAVIRDSRRNVEDVLSILKRMRGMARG